jgi:starch synthase
VALNILAVSSEAFPLAKTGGLGDAVSGLSQSLGECGVRVTLLLPAYPDALSHVRHVRRVAVLQGIPGGEAVLLAAECPELKLPVLLLKNDALFNREGLYSAPDGTDYEDNAIRFAALAHAAAHVARGIDTIARPHIVHAHDWHAALVPLLMHQLGVEDVKTVLTLHNVAFQGVFPMALARTLGIQESYCNDAGMEFWGQLNFLKAGIRYADLVTVVSQNYAREILTAKFGCGLEGVLAERRGNLVSIPNGIDTQLWNPEADEYLHGHEFSADNLTNKAVCKRELQRSFGLAQNQGATVMAMGSRLTSQKMADVAVEAIPLALDKHPKLQACVIGQGDKQLERALVDVAQRYPGRCSVHVGFDEAQAHLLHAGADVLLHGSRFEPFGLTPLYSMRYGTIPIGSRVGGMADTILDPGMHRPANAMRSATGILFEGEHPRDMALAIDRAMALRAQPEIWSAMQANGMRADFSWAKTAPSYLSVYQSLRPDVSLGRIPERYRSILPGRVWQPAAANAALTGYLPEAGSGSLARRLRKEAPAASAVSREASAA